MHQLKVTFVVFISLLGFSSISFAETKVEGLESPSPEQSEILGKAVKLEASKPSTPYPTAVLSRPFTIPANAFETTLKLKTGSHGADETAFYSLNTLSFAYGVTNDLELGLSWDGMKFDNLSGANLKATSSIALNAGYFLYAIPHIASMASLSIPFHFDREVIKTTSFSMPTSVSIINGKLAFLTFYYDTVKIHWREDANKKQYTVDFTFPLKLSYQATSNLIAGISTEIGQLSTDGKYSYIGKTTPLYLSATYAVTRALDIVAQTGFDDAQNWRNSFSFIAGLAYRFGAIDG
jgi:hypothetical protein